MKKFINLIPYIGGLMYWIVFISDLMYDYDFITYIWGIIALIFTVLFIKQLKK